MDRRDRVDHNPSWLGALLLAAATVALAGCGSTTTAAASPTPTPDVAAASAAALTIFFAAGQTPEVWLPCSARGSNFADCPFSAAVIAGLNHLTSIGFGGDATGCGEDYITGTQNGLNRAPQVLSAVADANGSVTVVIQRGPPPPNFTVTMTRDNGHWVASDLASGTGPSASMFSAKPNC
jgi:ABC-type Fe3+-hydroxamate transport system substrate-binding protein